MVLVYVLNKSGQPLMPCKPRKARLLLKANKAKVINMTPFTIQLIYLSTNYVQPITLGVDSGSKVIGLSATTATQELYASEVNLRTDIVDKLSTRRSLRRTRRNRKTRYRKARFNNRVHSKKKGWLPPSALQKINSHLESIKRVYKILPISSMIVEVASFDIQKIKNPLISGKEYQEGEQLNFWNIREYVLYRDNHVCQHCKGKSKDKILNVHHLESRKTGGDSPSNLVTLCETCHTGYHKGKIELKLKRGQSYKDAAFMSIMRWAFYNKLKDIYANVSLTYGYLTKNTRIVNNLDKTHAIDALCISGHPLASKLGYFYQVKLMRNHNRQIHKCTTCKGGTRPLNTLPRYVNGYQAFDTVRLPDNRVGFIKSRRQTGSFTIQDINGTLLKDGITYKKLRLLAKRRSHLFSMEQR